MRHRSPVLRTAAGLVCLLMGSCGGAQDRPSVVSVFPADGQVVAGWLGCIRVTYDEPVVVLSEDAARVQADAVEEGGVRVRIVQDPEDPFSILVLPDLGGHFFPNEEHHLVIQQGAVANADDHYARDEFESFFTVGDGPHLFVTTEAGSVYELDPETGAQVGVTAPPAGTVAHDPLGTDGRVWVWLDGAGDAQLGTFVPGEATITTFVTLSGEVGTRTGSHLVLDPAGHTLYATARDAGTNTLRVHRIDVATLTETGSIALSPTLSGAEPDFQPSIDREHHRLYVPFADGTAGLLAVVDLDDFVEVDMVPGAGVDALPMPDGAGDSAYESAREVLYVILEDEATPGFVLIGTEDFAQFPAREPTLVGAPEALYPTADGRWLVQGVSGYAAATQLALIRSQAADIFEGFAQALSDDVGAGPEGSTRVGVLLRDPTDTRFWAFADDGVSTVLAAYDFDPDFSIPLQVDFDAGLPGVQSLDLSSSAPGVVTGATTLFGACGP